MLSVEYVCVRVRVFFCECIGGSVCACMSAYMCLFIYLCMEVGGWGHMSSSLPRAHQLAMLSVQWDPGICLFVCAPPFPQHWGHKWVPPCLTASVGAGLWTIILMLVWLYTLYTLNHLSATGVCFKCFSKAGTKPKTLITAKPKALGPIPQVYILSRWRFFSCGCLTWFFKSNLTINHSTFFWKPHILSIEYLITEYIREQVMDKEYVLFLCVQFTQRVPGARDQGPGHSIKLPTKPVWV